MRLVTLLLTLVPLSGYPNVLLTRSLDAVSDAATPAIDGVPLLSGRLLADFYAQRGNEPVWTDPGRIAALLELVEASTAEGFAPADFHVEILRSAAKAGSADAQSDAERLALDLKLSDALLRYVHHTRFGKLDPVAVDRKWNDRAPVPSELLIADMQGALDAPDMGRFLAARMDSPFWYEDLKKALAGLSTMADLQGLAPLPAGPSLAKGSRGARVALLRERLQLAGHADAAPPQDLEVFDDSLAAAVMEFQRKVGLAPDGVVGPRTLATINNPLDQRSVQQVRINLERMRWLFNDLPKDYIFVDIADYIGYLVRGGEVAWSTRVIVGSEKDQTPMFRDSMDHVVFNPTWTVPVSIQKKMGNVSAKYTLVDRRTGRKVSGGNAGDYKRYRVVQKPGPGNALGRVKFMFPNRHAVYLHDTSSRGLFSRSSRALSHGCVRVQNPYKLAELLLGDKSWDRSKIERVVGNNQTRYVNLEEELPVLLYYLTARANQQGTVSFRRDIYGRDAALKDAFAEPVLRTRIAFPEPSPIAVDDATPRPTGDAKGDGPQQDQDPDDEGLDVQPPQSSVRLTQADAMEN
ncbi:L,D-transpeptidase family protein [Thiocystis violacea]|uniref:L,D-transpeptidase family protein n=1 Tax=Thiocystis violacea TaxID=13725 RepID=UPI001F5BCEDD|nr:L,D-transpeptidase family protein [Thiocystis violacea]